MARKSPFIMAVAIIKIKFSRFFVIPHRQARSQVFVVFNFENDAASTGHVQEHFLHFLLSFIFYIFFVTESKLKIFKGGLYLKPPKLEHIFVAVITSPPPPPPFFCADTFDTSLLLIVCALR